MSARAKVLTVIACTWIAAAFGQELARLNFTCGTTRPTETESTGMRRGKTFGYATFGAKAVLVIRVDFTNAPGAAVSVEYVTNVLASVDSFYRAISFRQLSLPTVAVTPVLRLAGDAREYAGRPLQIAAGARAAADAAGFSFNDYDFVIYTFPAIGFPYSGYGTVGGKGIWVPGADFVPLIVAHEFGHNLGLEHACSWTTPDDSLIGPGRAWDYGNSYDAMGNSPYFPDSGFNGNYRYLLGWLTDSDVHTVQTNGEYRLYAIDGENSLDWEKRYSLRVPAASSFNGLLCDYWIDYRSRFTYEHTRNGVLIQAATSASAPFGNLLLDMTPGTEGQSDAALIVGQTFEDRGRGIFITPIAVDRKNRQHIDIVVNRNVTNNRPPALEFTLRDSVLAPGASTTLLPQTSDPEDDTLAYSWDFGDGKLPSPLNTRQVEKSWSQAGVYPVACTVSDMKGGVARQTRVIRVGTPATFYISGRVLAGNAPVSGARVTTSNPAGHRRNCVTDDNGFYLLPNVADGTNTVRVVSARYTFSSRLIVPGETTTNVDFAAIIPPPIPRIVSVTPESAHLGETVTIAGTNFTDTTEVRFGNIYAAFAVTAPTRIVAVVPPGIAVASVYVTTPTGTAQSPSTFVVDLTSGENLLPSITRFEPSQAGTGALVRIVGVNLSTATTVLVGVKSAPFHVLSSAELLTVVPPGASSGSIVVVTPQGTTVSTTPFLVQANEGNTNTAPSIFAFSPRSGVEGDNVRIFGQNLYSVTNVLLGTMRTAFSVVSANEIHATIPPGALTTNLLVQTTNGNAASTEYFFVDLPRPLSLSTQPQGGTINEGRSWTFTVTAFGSGPLRYQWKKDGVNLAATNATLTITNATVADAGAYVVAVSNKLSAVMSEAATLEVLRIQDAVQQQALVWRTSPEAPWAAQSRITLDYPLAAESASGPLDSWIESTIEGTLRLTFWWQLSAQRFDDSLEFSVNGTNMARISGSTGWSKQSVELGQGTHVLRWTRRGSANALARLTQVTIEHTWFRQQPSGSAILAGEPVTLAALVSGAASLQWFRDGILLPEATNTTLSIGTAAPEHAGDYVLTLSNGLTTATSVVARLTVAPANILSNPPAQQAIATSNVTLSVEFHSIVPSQVRWLFESNPIVDATNRSIVIHAMPSTAGAYQAVISNQFGSVTSATATLLVIAEGPTLASNGIVDYAAFRGENVLLAGSAVAAPPPTYTWIRNRRRIRGANNSALSLPSIRAAQRGIYTAVAQNPFGSVTQQFRVSVQECAVLEQPLSQDVWAGDPLRLSVVARSASPIQYQWKHMGIPIAGATNAELFIPAARDTDSGGYHVQIRTRHRRLQGFAAEVSVHGLAPLFLRHPADQIADFADPVTLVSEADGHPAPSYRWFFEGAPLTAAQLSSLIIPVLTTNWEGMFTVVASNEYGTATSVPARVSIAQKVPDPKIAPGDFDTVAGNWIVLRSTRNFSPSATNLQWLRSGNPISEATNEFYLLPSITVKDSAKYRLYARNSLGEGTSSGTDIVVRNPRQLDQWHRYPPRPRTEDLRAITYGNGIFVAVGESGTVLTSPYGSQWRDVSLQTTSTIASITFSAGRFLAMVEDSEGRGILVASSNATDWTGIALPAARRLRNISSANGRYLVAAEGSRTNLIIAVSSNGTGWLETHFTIPAASLSVAATPNLYVAAGATNILVSDDGTNWNFGPPLPSRGVAYGAGTFVIVGPAGGVWSSTNGMEWFIQKSGTDKDLESVVFCSWGFVAAGEDGTVVTSPDGLGWKSIKSDTTLELACAATDGDRVVGAGEEGALVTFRGNLLETGVDPVSRITLNGIVFTNGLFVAVGNRGLILTSSDGRGWVPRSSSTDKDLLSIVCGPGGFVAVGEDGRIVASTDGFAWRTINSPAAIHLTRASFVNGRYYALGDGGTLLESMNGTNWTARVIQIPGREPALGNIAFNHGLYVAAGGYHDDYGFARSYIAVSKDGIAWAPQLEVNFGVKLRGIISYGDGYVVIGNDGLIAASVDGFRWRHQELGTEGENFRTLALLPDGVLVAAGNRGMVCSSADGTNWIRNRVITSKNLHDAAYGRESLVAVATDGTILVAEHLLPKLIPAGPKTASDITLHVELGLRDLYLLQESEDLLSWRNLQLFTNGTSSNVFRGVLPPPNSQRFYRLGWH